MLDGALALALPTHYGQDMKISSAQHKGLVWKSYDHQGDVWFEGYYDVQGSLVDSTDEKVGRRLEEMFSFIALKKENFFLKKNGILIETLLDFPNEWGLGSSSTMVHNLAKWAQVNPYELLNATMGGSGYDIACAGTQQPILYQLQEGKPFTQPSKFNPSFKEHLFFVYLEEKQNSRTGIQYYKEKMSGKLLEPIINNISIITKRMMSSTTIAEFQHLIKHHEDLVAKELGLQKVKEQRFSDYWGEVKSLGAWGGDFVLVTSKEPYKETERYFFEKGYHVFFSYNEIIL